MGWGEARWDWQQWGVVASLPGGGRLPQELMSSQWVHITPKQAKMGAWEMKQAYLVT